MILIDSNQVFISHLIVNKKINEHVNIETVRRACLEILIKIQKKFSENYGEMILAFDDKNCWRKTEFPFYKKNRKRERMTSQYNWDAVFSAINKMRDEFASHLCFKIIQVHGAEADDVIAVCCKNNLMKSEPEATIIVSGDKDFIQLQKYPMIKQYDPVKSRYISHENPAHYLREHIIRGDKSDGIPNILTSDDVLANGKNQKIMSKQKILAFADTNPKDFTNYVRLRNWKRNSQLIDFDNIPREIRDRISMTVRRYQVNPNISFDYFKSNSLDDLVEEFH